MRKAFVLIFICFIVLSEGFSQKIWNVLKGDYPDPSIIRVGDDFFMTHSSYNYVPGLLIWHSTNLKEWQAIGYALDKYLGDVWAPDFIVHEGTYYIYFPANKTNFVITAKSPYGPWSEPVDLKTSGIDPGHLVTPNGERYLYFNNGWMVKLTNDGLATDGEKKKVYDGWPIPDDWIIECFCLESPKMNYHNGYYYMTSAQGGTAGPSTSHMVVSARTKNPEGPWENSVYNPILRTWSPNEKWWSKGHGTLFDDASGNWFMIYHAYHNNDINMGRQVLIEPIKWTKDGWFRLKRKPIKEPETETYHNLVLENDDFSGLLKTQWQFSGIMSMDEVQQVDGKIRLSPKGEEPVVMHANTPGKNFEAIVKLESKDDKLEYGVVLFYDTQSYVGLGKKGEKLFVVDMGSKGAGPVIEANGFEFLRLVRRNNDLQMSFSHDGESWQFYPSGREVSGYQHNMLKGFRNLKIGIYCKGKGSLEVDDFQFFNNDI